MSECNGDTRPQPSYSPAGPTLGMQEARLCYSHFRLQVWNRKGRDPLGGAAGKVVGLGMNGEREAQSLGVQITS